MSLRPVSGMQKSFTLSLAVMLAASPLAAATSGSANSLDEGVTLKTAITVESDVITLGDVFEGFLSRPEKVVAQAPKPGQRMTLTADWLEDVARTYGIAWRPANSFDRAVVYQPGVTVTAAEILAPIRNGLIESGMPAHFDLKPAAPLAAVTLAATAPKDIGVRELVYDAPGKQFSALVQIPADDPQAVFLQVRGTAYPTIEIPVLKQPVGKHTTISAEMIDFIRVPQDEVRPSTIIDPNMLIGKTPKMFVRAGQALRESELAHVTLIELPMLAADAPRGERITADHIVTVAVDAERVPRDAVTTADFLIGKSTRRALAGNIPIRRGDVATVHDIEVPVLTRDIPRGATVTEADITWLTMNEADVVGEIVMDVDAIVGQVARLSLKGGQPVRKHSVAKAIAVDRGQMVTVLWSVKSINLTAQGHAMEKGGVGDVIRVTNSKSHQTVLAEIIDSRTVRVAAPDQVSSR
ncbi:MAG: flagellar basal body P-ring formation chaperone FlgA [Rhodospirillaceae bacterium]